ncbi:MAG TPA: hypothetical protein VM841_07525 [Actinomycetota bacterium]|nr:hypothetical protein [Actinomycetota bacterium]
MKPVALVVCLLAALLPGSWARASATIDIDVRSNFFAPDVARPVQGDTVRWTVRTGAHDVVTYAGAMSFASDMMSPSSPPYSRAYTGGEVLYRCTPHSTVSSSGICTGMCGVLTDRTAPPAAPVVAEPAPGATVPAGSVTFSGTAEPWVIVRLTGGGATLGEVLAAQNGAWSIVRSMAGGTHTVTALALGADGSQGGSVTRTFTVGGAPDGTPPEVTIHSGLVSGGAGRVFLFGDASDDVAVARIRIRSSDAIGRLLSEVVADCPECAAASVWWRVSVSLPPGVATVHAVADDLAGNASAPAGPVYAVVFPG